MSVQDCCIRGSAPLPELLDERHEPFLQLCTQQQSEEPTAVLSSCNKIDHLTGLRLIVGVQARR